MTAQTHPTPGRLPAGQAPRVALFVTCLVNVMRPAVAEATRELLLAAGARVEVPLDQTCCGQPAFNSGDEADGQAMARRQIEALDGYDYVVAPSGSCIGTIRHTYPETFAGDAVWGPRAERLAARAFEITSFLVDVLGFHPEPTRPADARATYHDTCSGLRELGVHDQPRRLLGSVPGLEMVPLPDANVCCGFGGTFCVKYPAISNAVVDEKARAIEGTGADILLGGDLGCLMNMAGRLGRRGSSVRAFHTVEALTGRLATPAIGEAPGRETKR
ncbi:(Fe-S)-binding protein [Aureimonas phyllosphaerae]|uniref:L-lactate dehydrogenase complex protein LldE n=1 Tax=Aureimonas phyllosphaerae TaxID=1166078 RepID=A0A7W6FVF7_9HYPH|nr:(Fe-S)-binding protein [Aureimonas phyllosphaerae]MBB3937143.1 L-lactate dehydrogenase complex protein LldE [Aureimonas phyllosphaerae]MBB3961220.1 L-lactate dehydrogenase complex protein LldE [Aureimonas phyllosphaerae]SFF52242.1 L-lactate dehydrogenase complex protein LldE [Aureimonas phyllosphaerae]